MIFFRLNAHDNASAGVNRWNACSWWQKISGACYDCGCWRSWFRVLMLWFLGSSNSPRKNALHIAEWVARYAAIMWPKSVSLLRAPVSNFVKGERPGQTTTNCRRANCISKFLECPISPYLFPLFSWNYGISWTPITSTRLRKKNLGIFISIIAFMLLERSRLRHPKEISGKHMQLSFQ